MRILILSFTICLQWIQVNAQVITAYSRTSFSGETFIFDKIGDFDIPPYITISSIKVPAKGKFMVSFDFNSNCNSLESGPMKFFGTDLEDIYAQFGCDKDFSKIRKIFIRPNIEYYPDKTIGFLYEEPYYMGKMVTIKIGACPDIIKLGLEKISSFQMPAGHSLYFYKSINFFPGIGDRMLGRRVEYTADHDGALKSYSGLPLPDFTVSELPERREFYQLPYIIDRWEKNMEFLKIKSVRFLKSGVLAGKEPNPELPCTLLAN